MTCFETIIEAPGTSMAAASRSPAGSIRRLPEICRTNQFVAKLVNPGAEAEGYTKGHRVRGASRKYGAADAGRQGIAQAFLGVNLQVRLVSRQFRHEYTLNDSYGLASIYCRRPARNRRVRQSLSTNFGQAPYRASR